MKLRTKEVLARTGISRQMLYRYIMAGLIREEEVTATGRRLFAPDVVEKIRLIRHVNESGYPLKDLKETFAEGIQGRTAARGAGPARTTERNMREFFNELRERGFISQATHEDPAALFRGGPITAYVGFDPTAESLQAGNLVPIMALMHLQRFGGKPIVLVGGATGLIGDPSGKLEARPMLQEAAIARNLEAQKKQFARFLAFGNGPGEAVLVNNADWFAEKGYIGFLREIGTHFSINRMIKLESVVNRLEKGLSYLEFNYMILQAYDFLVLFDRFGCRLQMGGDDQWGNIVMGMELIRRLRREEACGVTFPLITAASGQKMGKTEKGTIWLDAERTSPYEFYQYWINIEDGLTARCLNFYTLLPRREREDLLQGTGADLRAAKRVLAFEVTKLVHGARAAEEARRASEAAFGGGGREDPDLGAIPATAVAREELAAGLPILNLLVRCGLAKSNNDGRKLLGSGGLYVNDARFDDPEKPLTAADVNAQGAILLRKGRKTYHRVIVS
ncbi:MAG TPA: tyrosine--tRNA ligase [Planctomycetota bacterium]|nr:tyrosine--tRNA ligase [Planctomycetota bacterium]OQC20125.1 MAG: Tyrosine--tRNA ligase [Planctomycetes bacterium ADurb.Bin069]NMD36550.1 tyrosine--tRNA ligase [Planctomycetota bacterium]HNS00633.1 tyrosine--tRNA ligase [Planctomycetota bacterium]HNU26918.1 tyrosine--tRNA ligase [Planctomycetota bacterium]